MEQLRINPGVLISVRSGSSQSVYENQYLFVWLAQVQFASSCHTGTRHCMHTRYRTSGGRKGEKLWHRRAFCEGRV